jgi:aerobic carbon-monoxide dehydrogenase large subunit
VVSAALDALAPLGVTHLEMPLTSEQVWRRIREVQGGRSTPSKVGAGSL